MSLRRCNCMWEDTQLRLLIGSTGWRQWWPHHYCPAGPPWKVLSWKLLRPTLAFCLGYRDFLGPVSSLHFLSSGYLWQEARRPRCPHRHKRGLSASPSPLWIFQGLPKKLRALHGLCTTSRHPNGGVFQMKPQSLGNPVLLPVCFLWKELSPVLCYNTFSFKHYQNNLYFQVLPQTLPTVIFFKFKRQKEIICFIGKEIANFQN